MKRIFVEEKHKFLKIAILENGILEDIIIEEEGKEFKTGNIYKAKVEKILDSINACFLTCKGERFFMQLKERDEVKKGDILLIEVIKEKGEEKAPVVTTNISIPGRYLVYMPLSKRGGISRKITDRNERIRLREIISSIHNKEGTFIIRTEAKGKGKNELKREMKYLYKIWNEIRKEEKRKGMGLIYALNNPFLILAREKLDETVIEIKCNNKDIYKKILYYVKLMCPYLKKKVKLEKEKNLFKKYGLDEEIRKISSKIVSLPLGSYIVIEKTEALTSIDVNSGSVIEGDRKEVILKINKEAAKEIMRQIRLRNIGGIIIIDFIEMKDKKEKEEIYRILKEESEKDKAKIEILPVTKLGLVEMTRQYIGKDILRIISTKCPYCNGNGFILKKGI